MLRFMKNDRLVAAQAKEGFVAKIVGVTVTDAVEKLRVHTFSELLDFPAGEVLFQAAGKGVIPRL